MRAHAHDNEDIPAKRRRAKRKLITRTTPPTPPPAPPSPPTNPNVHYEAAWTDSWQHRRCMHKHRTLIEAARCAMPHACGWYVFAVENDEGRQLSEEEDETVNRFRFRR
jgi:hypothetical protein